MALKVVALVESLQHVCYRYRIEAFAHTLAQRGMCLEALPLERGVVGRLGQFRSAGRADVVLLQRKLLPSWQLAWLRRCARRLVYDVDDAVFQRDSFRSKGPHSRLRLGRFWATVYAADAVIVGNCYLKRYAARLIEASRIHVIPTCLQAARYPRAEHCDESGGPRLVWIGQPSMLPSLLCAQEHLVAAARRCPGLQLRLICDRMLQLETVQVVGRQWSAATEATELAAGQIGISWLPDDSWSRGKCGLKVLQYMAAGLPVVANPVGMHRRLVVHGRTGLLAATPQQWAVAIARLAGDLSLRRRMGEAGRRMVQRRYATSLWGAKFAQVVAGGLGCGCREPLPCNEHLSRRALTAAS